MNTKRKAPGLFESSCPADPMKLFEHSCASGVVANLVQAREEVGKTPCSISYLRQDPLGETTSVPEVPRWPVSVGGAEISGGTHLAGLSILSGRSLNKGSE